ncbi:MAG TPA: glycosyltransferase family 9 protein [Gammaproteobacteria bacterium]|nr:glycosyltransferase family 9 protein [Gammaproteobacteria bacterium]
MLKHIGRDINEILIFRALQLGDLLCAIPAIRALKNAHRQSRIVLIGLPWAADFADRFSRYFSGFISFPGFPGLIEQPYSASDFTNFISSLRQRKADLFIQMHGNGAISNDISVMSRASRLAGYYIKGGHRPDRELYMPYPEEVSEVRRHLKLMEFLGVPGAGEYLEFPVSDAEQERYRQLSHDYGLVSGSYVCIHPGARDLRRRWDAVKFAAVADMIAARGYRIVLTGAESEREAVRKVSEGMRCPAVDLSGKTGLGELALLIRNARLLYANDTGVSHIAAAMGTPSIIVFLISDPARWAPADGELHRVILPGESENVEHALCMVDEMLSQGMRKTGSE